MAQKRADAGIWVLVMAVYEEQQRAGWGAGRRGGGDHFWIRIAAFGSELITAQIKRICARSTRLSLKSLPCSPHQNRTFSFPATSFCPPHHHLPPPLPVPFLIQRWQAARLHTAAANWVNNKARVRGEKRGAGWLPLQILRRELWNVTKRGNLSYVICFNYFSPSLAVCVGVDTHLG